MIEGLFFDERMWNMDLVSSHRWNPEKYGVKIHLHKDHKKFETGVDKKYKFAIATEVWEEPMRDTLECLRNNGVKIFFLPRELMTHNPDVFFNYDIHLYKGQHFFCPDVVLAPSKIYQNLWNQKTKAYLVGHPKLNYCLDYKPNLENIRKKYTLSTKKKIFFSSHPPSFYKKSKGKDNFIDIFMPREETLSVLEKIANDGNAQVIVKIHPTTAKEIKKNINVESFRGIIKKYFNNSTENFKVFGDDRMYGNIGRELLVASDVVVGYTSTMLVEAAILKKSVVHTQHGVYRTVENRPRYDLVFDTTFDSNSLHNKLVSLLNNPEENYDVNQLGIFVHGAGDGNSCERICAAIKKETDR